MIIQMQHLISTVEWSFLISNLGSKKPVNLDFSQSPEKLKQVKDVKNSEYDNT